MLNGSTLKICFLMIVITLCALLVMLVAGVVFFKFPIEDSKILLGMMGIPALFGMIAQAFIHANITDVSNKQAIVAPTVPVAPITIPVVEVKP